MLCWCSMFPAVCIIPQIDSDIVLSNWLHVTVVDHVHIECTPLKIILELVHRRWSCLIKAISILGRHRSGLVRGLKVTHDAFNSLIMAFAGFYWNFLPFFSLLVLTIFLSCTFSIVSLSQLIRTLFLRVRQTLLTSLRPTCKFLYNVKRWINGFK